MKHWKKFLAISLGFTMLLGQAAYADMVIVPPAPTLGAQQGGLPLPGAAGSGEQTGQTSAAESEGGSASGTVDAAGPAGGAGSSSGQSAGQSDGQSAGAAAAEKPEVAAEGAVLMDAATGQVLFGKNQDTQFYPASITKVMTALVVLENCRLDETVTFSETATTNLESGAVSLGITEGDQLTVEQCLYGLLLKSANEIGNGLAEHVAGSVSAFADKMNAKAKELGCRNTHFANPHGLNDSTHKTTPYDMALILRAALENETFRKIDTTRSYEFPATKKAAARTITMGHKMMYPTDSRYYEGIIGGKTGYTSKAGNTLVTGVEKNGVRLIAVVMKAKSTQYTDTIAMLDYGFANYGALTGGSSAASGSTGQGSQAAFGGTAQQSGGSADSTVQGTDGSTDSTAQGTGSASGWFVDENGWYYIKADGSRAANEWLSAGGREYWIDGNGCAATGWRSYTDGSYYYFSPADCSMVSNSWIEDGGSWYYLGSDGRLLTNTTTPEGYRVNEYGIWDGQDAVQKGA
ncbi:MAG: serine hydrolase [Eubacteriales bacterium]|nr:serine hydrolase [Eubacteriales bacterium]